jgi:hypothetical protein
VHIADDVKKFGHLDGISGYPFENFLGQLKRSVRKPLHILQQISNRVHDGYFRPNFDEPKINVKKNHHLGPVPVGFTRMKQYQKVSTPDYLLSISDGNNCICYGSKKIGLVKNILSNDSDVWLVVDAFRVLRPTFDEPLQ